MKKLIYILAFLIGISINAQHLTLFDIDDSDFPTMRAKFYAFDKNSEQLFNLSPSDFELFENGEKRQITNISCPTPKPPLALSSVLVMDVSGSMAGKRLEMAKEAAKAWILGLPLGKSECAITAFNNRNYFIQDFTTDRNLLIEKSNLLFAEGGTNYNAAFIGPMAGGLIVTKDGFYKKVLIILSDGHPNSEPNTNEIIAEAKAQGVTIYAVTLDMRCPKNLKDITTQTGGLWFENVTTLEQARTVYRNILNIAQGGENCTIEWTTKSSCEIEERKVTLKWKDVIEQSSYQISVLTQSRLMFEPHTIKFKNALPGFLVEKNIIATSIKSNYVVNKITLSNPLYSIYPNNFSLEQGESIELTLSYLPTDSGYTFCKIEFENDVCHSNYYVSAGFQGVKPATPTLKLLHPNGGEVFVAGSDTIITWEGIPPNEQVTIEYQSNENEPWIRLTDTATGYSYEFNVPKIPSDKYLARVIAKLSNNDCDDVKIGEQIWMGCNLDVDFYRNGERIRYAATNEEWLDANSKGEGAWCIYNNDFYNDGTYGKLYNWYAVNDPRGLAPEGWRVASDNDWKELEEFIGGSEIAGGILKAQGTIELGTGFWSNPNSGASDLVNFSALPGGSRSGFDASFHSLNDIGYWWTSTQYNIMDARVVLMFFNNTNLDKGLYSKKGGFSVRCIKE